MKITLTQTGELAALLEGHGETSPQRHFGRLIFCESEAQLKLLDEGGAVVIDREPPSEIVVDDGVPCPF